MRRACFQMTVLAAFCLLSQSSATVSGQNQAQPPQFPPPAKLSGIVVQVTEASCVVVEKTGALSTLKIGTETVFILRKGPADRQSTLRVGMSIKAILGADGVASQVTSSGMAKSVAAPQLKALLNVSEEEWSALSPKIERIQQLQQEAALDTGGNNGNNGNGNGGGGGSTTPGPVQTLDKQLHDSVFNPEVPPQILAENIMHLKEAKARARADLAAAQHDLVVLLTPKQEAILMVAGLLD